MRTTNGYVWTPQRADQSDSDVEINSWFCARARGKVKRTHRVLSLSPAAYNEHIHALSKSEQLDKSSSGGISNAAQERLTSHVGLVDIRPVEPERASVKSNVPERVIFDRILGWPMPCKQISLSTNDEYGV